MSREWVLLFEHDSLLVGHRSSEGAFQFQPLDVSDAQGAYESLASQGYRSEDVLMVVGSSEFYSGSIDPERLPAKGSEEAKSYLFEEKLPVPVEDLVLKFKSGSESVQGRGLNTVQLKSLVESLEELGVSIEWIVPKILLILQATEEFKDSEFQGYLLIKGGLSSDLVYLNQGELESWRWGSEESLKQRAELEHSLIDESEIVIRTYDLDENPLLIQGIENHYRGRSSSNSNYRAGSLEPRDRIRKIQVPLMASIAALAVACLMVACSFYLKAQDFSMIEKNSKQKISEHFDKNFPAQKQPQSVRRRFESRYQELLSAQLLTQGGHSKGHGTLWSLRHFLASIPKDMRYLILELRIKNLEISVSGQARSHSETDRIVASLREGGGFNLTSPRTTKQKDGGVSFRFDGQRVKPNPQTAQVKE